MRTWYKYITVPLKANDNNDVPPSQNDEEEFSRIEVLMGGYSAEQGYESREVFFERYLAQEGVDRKSACDKFLRKHLNQNMHVLSVGSARAANEMALIQDGFDITCSDLNVPDCVSATKNLFGNFTYETVNILKKTNLVNFDAVITISTIYNFDLIQLDCCFDNIYQILNEDGILILDYASAPDNIWSYLYYDVFLQIDAWAYAVFRMIKDWRLYTVLKTFHGYRHANMEIENAAISAGLELYAYKEESILINFQRGYLLPKLLGLKAVRSLLLSIGCKMPYVRLGAFQKGKQ